MSALPKLVSWSKGTSLVALLSRWYRSQQFLAEKIVHYMENNGTINFSSDFKGLNYWPRFSPPLLIVLSEKLEIYKGFLR